MFHSCQYCIAMIFSNNEVTAYFNNSGNGIDCDQNIRMVLTNACSSKIKTFFKQKYHKMKYSKQKYYERNVINQSIRTRNKKILYANETGGNKYYTLREGEARLERKWNELLRDVSCLGFLCGIEAWTHQKNHECKLRLVQKISSYKKSAS